MASVWVAPDTGSGTGSYDRHPVRQQRLAGPSAGLTVDGVHVKVDGCLGPVAVRSYVTVAISTPLNDNTVNVYGKPTTSKGGV
nr:MspA family porin [Gordonia sp. HS-NH1]